MTLDEAIRHCYEVAENYRCQRDDAADINDVGTASDCQNCADEHEQLASWLRELQELREGIGSVKLSNMKEALALIRTLKAELNGWKEDPFSIIAEVCRSVTDCRRCQWYEKCPFSKNYESYPEEWRD